MQALAPNSHFQKSFSSIINASNTSWHTMRLRLLMLPRLNRALIRSNTAFNTSLITESLNIHLSRRNFWSSMLFGPSLFHYPPIVARIRCHDFTNTTAMGLYTGFVTTVVDYLKMKMVGRSRHGTPFELRSHTDKK